MNQTRNIELGKALERLKNNPDFKLLFDEYLFNEYIKENSLDLHADIESVKEILEHVRFVKSLFTGIDEEAVRSEAELQYLNELEAE